MVLAEARTWIGTPYRHQADMKGVGADCIMILVRVFADTGLIQAIDPRPYADEWFLHRSEELYIGGIEQYAHEVSEPSPGDVMVFRWGRCYAHGGLVTVLDPLTIIHAYQPATRVIEQVVALDHRLSDPDRAPRFFSIWDG